jgi:hypothetical protein
MRRRALRLTGAVRAADTDGVADSHLDLIARIHAGFDAQTRLAASLHGRTVAVRGATDVERAALDDDLARCGATEVDDLADAQALVAGSAATESDAREAVARRIAIVRTPDVALIADTRARIARRSELAYTEAVDRALADARRLVAERDRRVAAALHADPVAPTGGMRIRGGDDRAA